MMPGNTSTRMCERFLNGRCPFSAVVCNFSHSKDHAPICRMWQKGFCIGATGNACRLRHYYNEMDGAVMQAARQAQRTVNNCPNQMESYSSPYTVKVVKQVAKQRKEEVDLETGKRKSWVETTEFEVLDLTGETPPMKKRLSLNKSPLKEANYEKENERIQNPPPKNKVSEASSVEPGTCPVCARKFKGEKGVNAHRRARNSACHPDKENQKRNQQAPAVATPVTRRNVVTTPTQESRDDSVTFIPDTPVPGNRRLSLRRSIRMV